MEKYLQNYVTKKKGLRYFSSMSLVYRIQRVKGDGVVCSCWAKIKYGSVVLGPVEPRRFGIKWHCTVCGVFQCNAAVAEGANITLGK